MHYRLLLLSLLSAIIALAPTSADAGFLIDDFTDASMPDGIATSRALGTDLFAVVNPAASNASLIGTMTSVTFGVSSFPIDTVNKFLVGDLDVTQVAGPPTDLLVTFDVTRTFGPNTVFNLTSSQTVSSQSANNNLLFDFGVVDPALLSLLGTVDQIGISFAPATGGSSPVYDVDLGVVTAVPEPSTVLLGCTALVGLATRWRRRRHESVGDLAA